MQDFGGTICGGPQATAHVVDEENAPRRPGNSTIPDRCPAAAFARVPCDLLGSVLDLGPASADAAHLLAIKCSKGPGFALNQKHVKREYGIGRPSFRAGIRTLRQARVLWRGQPRRNGYAVEELAEGSAGYVMVSEELLRCRSALVAFVLVVNLSQEPLTPECAARRIGITSRGSIRKLKDEAIATGEVAHDVGPRGLVLLARKGHKFDMVKNVPAENVPAKNVTAHSRWKESQEKEERAQEKESALAYGSAHSRELGANDGFEAGFEKQRTCNPIGPEWQVLSDWTSTNSFRTWRWAGLPLRDAIREGKVKVDPVSDSEWERLLTCFAGQEPVPGHLKTPATLRQVSEIVCFLCAVPGRRKLSPYMATAGLAFAVVKAFTNGKPIRSLGFIAHDLTEKIRNGDLAWYFDWPSRLPDDEFRTASALATQWAGELKARDFPIDREEVLSTLRVETLASMLRKYTLPFVVAGINVALKQRRPPEGMSACCWTWFEDEIRAEWDMAERRARQRSVQHRSRQRAPSY